MTHYINKNYSVKAVQWNGKNTSEVMSILPEKVKAYRSESALTIIVNLGMVTILLGDWVVVNERGVVYCEKPLTFTADYKRGFDT